LERAGHQWIVQLHEMQHHLGLTGEPTAKRRKEIMNSRTSLDLEGILSALPVIQHEEETDSEDDDQDEGWDFSHTFTNWMSTKSSKAQVRTGKESQSQGHFASRSAWRTPSGAVVFIHDFACFGGRLELLGRPQDTKAVEQGDILGQNVCWHPPAPLQPAPKPQPHPLMRSSRKENDEKQEGDRPETSSTGSVVSEKDTGNTMLPIPTRRPEEEDEEEACPPIKGWFDGRMLYWEPVTKKQECDAHGTGEFHDHEHEEAEREVQAAHDFMRLPKFGELPPGPWVRITSAYETAGVPGPDSGLWTLQTSFFAECHGPLPLEFLERVGAYQAGKGAKELYERTRRDAQHLSGEDRNQRPLEEASAHDHAPRGPPDELNQPKKIRHRGVVEQDDSDSDGDLEPDYLLEDLELHFDSDEETGGAVRDLKDAFKSVKDKNKDKVSEGETSMRSPDLEGEQFTSVLN